MKNIKHTDSKCLHHGIVALIILDNGSDSSGGGIGVTLKGDVSGAESSLLSAVSAVSVREDNTITNSRF